MDQKGSALVKAITAVVTEAVFKIAFAVRANHGGAVQVLFLRIFLATVRHEHGTVLRMVVHTQSLWQVVFSLLHWDLFFGPSLPQKIPC